MILMVAAYSTVSIYHNVSIQFPIIGHLVCFSFYYYK